MIVKLRWQTLGARSRRDTQSGQESSGTSNRHSAVAALDEFRLRTADAI